MGVKFDKLLTKTHCFQIIKKYSPSDDLYFNNKDKNSATLTDKHFCQTTFYWNQKRRLFPYPIGQILIFFFKNIEKKCILIVK